MFLYCEVSIIVIVKLISFLLESKNMVKGGKGNSRQAAKIVTGNYLKKCKQGHTPVLKLLSLKPRNDQETHPLWKYAPIELKLDVESTKYCILAAPDVRQCETMRYNVVFKPYIKANATWSIVSFPHFSDSFKFFEILKGAEYDLVAVLGYGGDRLFKQGGDLDEEARNYGLSSLRNLDTKILDLRAFSHPLVEKEDFVLKTKREVGNFLLNKILHEIPKHHSDLCDFVEGEANFLKKVKDLNFLYEDDNRSIRLIAY